MIDYTEGSNKQYHTQLEENGVGDYVILTGDPKRVKDIASYLDDAYFVADNREYAPIEFPAVPHFEVLNAQVESAKKLNLPYHVGVVQSKDSFFGQHAPETMPVYQELQNKWDAYCRLDCLASEMESSTVFIVGQTRHVRSGAMFLCLANQEREKAGLSNIQNHDLKPLMKCAVLTLKNLIQKDEAENH